MAEMKMLHEFALPFNKIQYTRKDIFRKLYKSEATTKKQKKNTTHNTIL